METSAAPQSGWCPTPRIPPSLWTCRPLPVALTGPSVVLLIFLPPEGLCRVLASGHGSNHTSVMPSNSSLNPGLEAGSQPDSSPAA